MSRVGGGAETSPLSSDPAHVDNGSIVRMELFIGTYRELTGLLVV
jgi:hypothetical protein